MIDVGKLSEQQTQELMQECMNNLDEAQVVHAIKAVFDQVQQDEIAACLSDHSDENAPDE